MPAADASPDLSRATTPQLITTFLAAADEDRETWEPALDELQARATRDTFDAAVALLASEAMPERELGVDILGRLGAASKPPCPFRAETVPLLLDLLDREREPRVLESLAYALGDLEEAAGVGPLSALAGHPEARVRLAVVDGLRWQEDDRAVDTLIRLSADENDDIRDWATFRIGTTISRDTPAIRAALDARLDDPHHDTREEAMYGLAMRLDPRAVPVLLEFLEEYEGPMLDSALLVLGDHLDDARLPTAIARRWPDGVPADARERADSDYEVATWKFGTTT